MDIDMSKDNWPRRRATGKASIEYRLIFLVSFLLFVVATVIERLMPWTWLQASEDGQRRLSIVGKAWDAAETCTTYAFMG
jgi:hypothetical protein